MEPKPLSKPYIDGVRKVALRTISEGRPIGHTLADLVSGVEFWRNVVRTLPLRYHARGNSYFHECPVCDHTVTKENCLEAAAHKPHCAWLTAQDIKMLAPPTV
jgi:hypothetical protein